jgi:penicillin amidase
MLTVADVLGSLGVRRLFLHSALPPAHEMLSLLECRHPVEVLVDRHGVPHIYASEAADLFLALGYCHARDRLWQMELHRRIARGELAELFGPRTLDADRLLRRLGFRHDAENELAKLDTEVRTLLNAYAAGVNAYVAQHRLPIEFTLLRSRPRPWQSVDSLAFARYMGWTLSVNAETELIRWRLAQGLGVDRAAELEPQRATRFLEEAGLLGGASNCWVVSGERSATGRPLLASDPHLRPRIPALWYVAHLHGGGYDVVGATLPGVLGVLLGHNDRVAWGLTAAFVDCQDVFIEKAHPERPNCFAHGDEWYEAVVRREEIRVKGAAAVVEEVVRTRHGPLLNGLLDIPADGPPLALCALSDGTPSSVRTILRLNRATDVADFRAALKDWLFPALNFLIADTAGNIGYQLAVQAPVRAAGDGTAPAPGWDESHDWVGSVPFEDLPVVTNPRDGILASANNRPEPACRHELGNAWCGDGRQRRILELLRDRQRHSLLDFEAMLADVVSLPAQAIARRLSGAARIGTAGPLVHLVGWNGSLAAESVAASIYEVFRDKLIEERHRQLPPALLELVRGQGLYEMLAFASVFQSRGADIVLAHLDELLADGKGHIAEDALEATFTWLVERFGPEPAAWQWGRLHQVRFDHVFGAESPLLDRLLRLNRGPFPLGGDGDTIAQSGVDPWHRYEAATFTVSYRQILDVGNWDDARFILPTGQSGHPGSPHYDDMMDECLRGAYRPLLFSRAAVESETTETIRLNPQTTRGDRGA